MRSGPALIVLGALLVAAPACRLGRPPHLIVIVVDTLRADRLGAWGNRDHLTPFLDALATRGTVFRNAHAAATWTNPSVASLFTSRYPSQHGVTSFDARLPDAEVTVAERLAAAGYVTLGFTANLRLSAELGFAQGFRGWGSYPTVRKLRAKRLRRRALAYTDLVRGTRSTKPVFLYLQYMEPHAPYRPPAPFRARFVREASVDSRAATRKLLSLRWATLTPPEIDHLASLYDGEVAALDHDLRRLFDGLRRRGLLDDAVVVVTADHGEEFWEHALMSHGDSLYDPELRVPLLVVGDGVPAGRVVTDAVSLVDVAPTLLALAGLPPEARFEGRSLVPLLTGAAPPVDVIAELPLETPGGFDPRRHTAAILRGDRKLLALADAWAAKLGDAEVYDVAADPRETRPLGYVGGPRGLPADAPELPRAQALLAALRAREATLAHSAAPAERVPLDKATTDKLRALGYVD